MNLRPYYAAHKFGSGCASVKSAFNAASSSLHAELARAQKAKLQYLETLEAGGADERIEDDGQFLYWKSDELEMDVENIVEALMVMRKSFVVAIYHHWERAIIMLSEPTKKMVHKDLVAAALDRGVKLDPKLEGIYNLTNLLKHNNEEWVDKLRKSWPEVVPEPEQHPLAVMPDWYNSIRLTDQQVHDAFEAVGRSGPRIQTSGAS